MGLIFDLKRYAIHDGPGIRTTVFFKGCPLTCVWCHNPEGKSAQPELMWKEEQCIACRTCESICPYNAISFFAKALKVNSSTCNMCTECAKACPGHALQVVGILMSAEEILCEIEKDVLFYDESGGGVTFSGGEPLMQPHFLCSLLRICKEHRIHTVVDTSGAASTDVVQKIAPFVDLFLYDIKTMNEKTHQLYTGASNALILHNLEILSHSNEVIVRIPVIPGINDNQQEARQIGKFLSSLRIEKVSILAYHRAGVEKAKRLIAPHTIWTTAAPAAQLLTCIEETLEEYGLHMIRGG